MEGGGTSSVQLFTRGKYMMNSIFTGKEGARWLEQCIEENIVREEAPAFIRTFTESDKGYVIRRFTNKHGRYLEVTDYGRRGCKGKLVILESQKHSGWQGFNTELHLLLNSLPDDNNGKKDHTRQEYSRQTEDNGHKRALINAMTKAATSYANSLRTPTKAKPNPDKATNVTPQLTQNFPSKILKIPKLSGLRVKGNHNEEKARYAEKFLGFTAFRNTGRDVDYNSTSKLTISCSANGKREVTWGKQERKPNKERIWLPRE